MKASIDGPNCCGRDRTGMMVYSSYLMLDDKVLNHEVDVCPAAMLGRQRDKARAIRDALTALLEVQE